MCALLVGFTFGGNPALITAICLIWGFAVVADSAQFSAAISELCRREYTGTALTIQTSLGFLLTIITIRLIPTLVGRVGWEWAFALLALGPAMGIWAMGNLRNSPVAVKWPQAINNHLPGDRIKVLIYRGEWGKIPEPGE